MAFSPDKLFNDLPLLLPKVEIETKSILKKAISAPNHQGQAARVEPGSFWSNK